MNLDEFESFLTGLSLRSKGWQIVKAEVQKRGYWKNHDRGSKRPKQVNIARQFTPLSTHLQSTQQSNENWDDEIYSI